MKPHKISQKGNWFGLTAVVLLMGMLFSLNLEAQKRFDMSEAILKLNPTGVIHDMGEKGFALHDVGTNSFKLFDWDYRLVKEFPLGKGEGPGEIKQSTISACFVGENFLLHGLFEDRVNLFDPQGKYTQTTKLGFIPSTILYRNNRLYLFKISFDPSEPKTVLGEILDAASFKKIKKIELDGQLISKELFEGHREMIGFTSLLDVDQSGHIFLLLNPISTLYELDEKGKLVKKVKLPLEYRQEVRTEKRGEEYVTVYDTQGFFTEMRISSKGPDDGIYVGFSNQIKRDKTGKRFYKTHILKCMTGEIKENIFDGKFGIIGLHGGNLYLFDTSDYTIMAVPTAKW